MITNYLDFYKERLPSGELPGGYSANGLCCLIGSEDLYLISPTDKDEAELKSKDLCDAWWASELKWSDNADLKGLLFNPLRQNLILLLAAYHGQIK